ALGEEVEQLAEVDLRADLLRGVDQVGDVEEDADFRQGHQRPAGCRAGPRPAARHVVHEALHFPQGLRLLLRELLEQDVLTGDLRLDTAAGYGRRPRRLGNLAAV